MPDTYPREAEVACHSDHTDHEVVGVEAAHSLVEGNRAADRHQVHKSLDGHKDEGEVVAGVEDPSFGSHRSLYA